MSDTLWALAEREYFPRRVAIQSPLTVRQYRFAFQDFDRCLGRPATLDDLTDDNLAVLTKCLLARGLCAKTVNERVGRIKTIWTWLARRGHVRLFPTLERLPEPRRTPSAWTEDELRRLFAACEQEQLQVGPLPGPAWWRAFLGLAWNTSERVSAILACRWDWLADGTLHVPAEARKAQTTDMVYRIWPETLELIEALREPQRQLILPWPYHWPTTFYGRYRRILKRAGLPVGRKNGPHKMRVSHATWCRVLSGQHAASLGHASSSTTERYYEDTRIIRRDEQRTLFVPWRDVG